jgi:hypothetical protein
MSIPSTTPMGTPQPAQERNDQPETFVVTLRAMKSPIPADVRLARFLKSSLRGYGLRCIGVRSESQFSEKGKLP